MWKVLRNIVFYCSIFVLIALGAAVYYANTHEEEIKAYALEAIQEHLVSDVDVQNIELSLIQHFPAAALTCENVLIYDTFEDRDTLIFAKELALEFNIIELIQGKYEVQGVSIDEALVKLKRRKNGEVNYTFWKASEAQDSSQFRFALEGANFSSTRLLLHDEPADLNMDLQFDELLADGDFDETKMRLDLEMDAPLAWIEVDGTSWLNRVPIDGKADLEVLLDDEKYIIHSSALSVNGNDIEGSGSFQNTAEHVLCAFRAQGNKLNLAKVLQSLPPRVQESLKPYEISGNAQLSCEISGAAGGSEKPLVQLKGSVNKGKFTHKAEDIDLEDIQSTFAYTFGEKETLDIQELSAELDGGRWNLSGSFENLSDPWVNVKITGNSDLGELLGFLDVAQIASASGKISLEGELSGKLPKWRYDEGLSKINARALIKDVSIVFLGDASPYEKLNGEIALVNGDANVKQLSGKYQDSDFLIEASLKGLMNHISKDQLLFVDGSVLAQKINLNNWIPKDQDASAQKEKSPFSLPKNIKAQVSVKVNEIRYDDALGRELTSTWGYTEGEISCKQVSLFLADGKLQSSGKLRESSQRFTYTGEAQFQGVNIQKLFADFNNFDQKTILAENIKGKCDLNTSLTLEFDRMWNFLSDRLLVEADINMNEGELIGLSSLMEVPGYLRENKVVAPFVDINALEKELKHIYFSSLSNHISVANSIITIPKMNISSSVMDLSIEGTHSFEQAINYSLGFYLRDLLIDKSSTDYGKVEDDGLGNWFFLSMSGTTDDPSFGYDRLAHKKQRKEDFQEEKQTLKEIIKEDLNPFKKNDKKGDDNLGSKEDKGEGISISVNSSDASDEDDNGGLKSLFKSKNGERKKKTADKSDNKETPPDDDDF